MVAEEIVSDVLVTPESATPFLYHWQLSGAEPVAETVNDIGLPASTVWLTGLSVMTGAPGETVIVPVPRLEFFAPSYAANVNTSVPVKPSPGK